MALLYRFTRLQDRQGTCIYTFIVTRSVTRDLHRDATTKEFPFGHQRWVVSFDRTDGRTLGVHLILRNGTTATRCYLDLCFCLLNREHYSHNHIYFQKQCRFSADQPVQGPSRWIPMSDLHSLKFSDEKGEFLLDLVLCNPLTVYETDLRMTLLPFHKLRSAETAHFAFGGCEWNVAVHPQGTPDDQETSNRPKVLLNRLTGFDHAVRVQYKIILGGTVGVEFDSGILNQVSDVTGKISGFPVTKVGVSDLLRRGLLHIYVEMYSANAVSEVPLPLRQSGDPGDPGDAAPNCYDRDKHAWLAEADVESECMRLKLFCIDPHLVPRNHLRYVSWNAYVMLGTKDTNNRRSVLNAPHCNYYIQEGVDLGIVMETDVPASMVDGLAENFAEPNKSVTVQIEWLDSLLLFSAIYHKYDDIRRLHCHQMHREIQALQDEQYALERQLFSYQKTISVANARGQADMVDEPSDEVIASTTPQFP